MGRGAPSLPTGVACGGWQGGGGGGPCEMLPPTLEGGGGGDGGNGFPCRIGGGGGGGMEAKRTGCGGGGGGGDGGGVGGSLEGEEATIFELAAIETCDGEGDGCEGLTALASTLLASPLLKQLVTIGGEELFVLTPQP